MKNQTDLLTDDVLQLNLKERKELLPWWVKIFSWMFIVFGAFVPVGILFGILRDNFLLSLYGLSTNEPFSWMGLFISLLYLEKGITGFGLIFERDWAVILAIFDALLGIGVCALMLVLPFFMNRGSGFEFSFRLELVFLIPYLLKMQSIKNEWETAAGK